MTHLFHWRQPRSSAPLVIEKIAFRWVCTVHLKIPKDGGQTRGSILSFSGMTDSDYSLLSALSAQDKCTFAFLSEPKIFFWLTINYFMFYVMLFWRFITLENKQRFIINQSLSIIIYWLHFKVIAILLYIKGLQQIVMLKVCCGCGLLWLCIYP